MKDVWDYISNWPVLKWVILVLVAGFIGQFGKMLAEAIIAKVRKRREERQTSKTAQTHVAADSTPPAAVSPEPSAPSAGAEAMPDKKMLKALAKARKKEAKK